MDKETLAKINTFTRREFKAEELYVFPITLCDNDIDRDMERFSDAALEKMQQLFIGKTGIFDHTPTANNQEARVFDTEVIADSSRSTKDGRPYKYLKGMAYMVRTDANKNLISEIDAGIKKEVSVSCSSAKRTCSICGADTYQEDCEHRKGKEYDGVMCHYILDDITDAYEWSFVAVPAQINAGVTKKYKPKEEKSMEFKPITTQEELDAAIKPAVDAAVAETKAQYEGYISPEAHQTALDAAKAESKSYELKYLKLDAALKAGLPIELADKISGETAEDIQKDAESFAQITCKSTHQPRRFSPEHNDAMTGVEREFYARNPKLKEN